MHDKHAVAWPAYRVSGCRRQLLDKRVSKCRWEPRNGQARLPMAEGDADLAIRSLSSTPNSRSLPDVALFSGEQFPKGHSFFIDCIDHAVPCAPQPCSSSDAAVAVVARRPVSSMSWGKDANPSPGAGRQELHGLGQDKIMTHLQCGFRGRDVMTELGALSSLRSRDGDK